ncbi:MAG: tRNA (adenosine(37)-N6)-threonylcarbamoyltransferase complex ATPase subunit type 1 TsaE [Candidatus Aminicenantales bacterium]|jgi:tRNA threonylcarbamoyladenosine biosynthesis protein TsaE
MAPGGGETTDSVFFSYSAEETLALGKTIALKFKGNEVVFLIGELGAGKTVFAKGISAGLGLNNVHEVCSPTFTIMNIYRARVPIYHFDLYRLTKDSEIMDLGFEDYVGQGVVVVEWAEKIRFPIEALHVRIVVEDGGRRRIEIR